MKHKAILLDGPVGPTLIKLTLPMIIGMLGIVIFNLVDTFFVGRIGTTELAAMSFTLPVVMLQGSISMGLGVGASAVIARAIGQKNKELEQRYTTDSLFLSVTIVVIMISIGLLTINPLFRLLGASETLLPLIREYMIIWYIGVPFIVIPMVGNNAIRAAGNTLIPSIIMVFSIGVNIILDPLLIFGMGPFPEMGLEGAALATVISRALTLPLALYYLHFKFDMLTVKIPKFSILFVSWKKILFIGIPAAITQLIFPISMGVITRIVSQFGKEAVAAFGVGGRIEMFVLSPLMALSSVLIPFIGQNLGAGKTGRIKESLKLSHLFSFGFGLILFLIFLATSRFIAPLFNSNPEVYSAITLYLSIVSLGFGLQGILFINASAFNALNAPLNSTLVNLLRTAILYIPLAYLGAKFLGIKGIFLGACLSAIISGIVSWKWIKQKIQKIEYSMEPV